VLPHRVIVIVTHPDTKLLMFLLLQATSHVTEPTNNVTRIIGTHRGDTLAICLAISRSSPVHPYTNTFTIQTENQELFEI
jgi:hypothetical protein